MLICHALHEHEQSSHSAHTTTRNLANAGSTRIGKLGQQGLAARVSTTWHGSALIYTMIENKLVCVGLVISARVNRLKTSR